MSIERGISFNKMQKRYDLVIFGRDGTPILCAECKAPEITIGDNAVLQLSVYNSELKAKYLLLTNGPEFKLFKKNAEEKFLEINALPLFGDW